MIRRWHGVAAAIAGLALAGGLAAQTQEETQRGIEAYRQALQQGNPAELYEARGEELWKKPSGPRNGTLEQCDLGLGPGKVEGAYARLPRYFADTDKVQDLESRLLTCMERYWGVDPKPIVDAAYTAPAKREIIALTTYISGEAKDAVIDVRPTHPKERVAFELGKRMFFFQAGPHDFSCATCHGEEGKRIRLQDLPNITERKGSALGWGSWPAYRVSAGQMWTMQWRIQDCFRQMRFPEPIYASEATIALSVYMAAIASGEPMRTPGIKR